MCEALRELFADDLRVNQNLEEEMQEKLRVSFSRR